MAELTQNVARQRMAEALKRMRRGGMTEETMRTTSLGDLFKKSEHPRASLIQSRVGFDMSKSAGDLVGGYIGELYGGKKDTLADKLATRRQEKRDFAQAQRKERQERQDKFISKRDELRKKSLKNFGGKMGDGPDTPGLERQDAMQKAEFGGNTRLAGSVGKMGETRSVSSEAAAHGAAERGAFRAGDVAGAREHRKAKFAARKARGGILKQEQRMRLQEKQKEVAREDAELDKAQRMKDKTAKINAKAALKRAKAAKRNLDVAE